VTLNTAKPKRTSSSTFTFRTLSLVPHTHLPAHRLQPSPSYPPGSVWSRNRTGLPWTAPTPPSGKPLCNMSILPS
jgi:hypothetical protein